jgi:hypothetical protein
MGHVIALAFASAASLTPQLLAVVLVILTRPQPRALLWSFYLTALVVSIAASYIILVVFRSKGTILGMTASKVSPTVYLIIGVIALAVALFAATKRGRELLGRELEKAQQKQADGKADHEGSFSQRVGAKADEVRSKAQEALKRGSVLVAIVVGVVLGAPTAFSPLAVGTMVTHGYHLLTQLVLIVVFSLITYIVVEVPIVSYALWPEATEARVEGFSNWLSAHKIQAVAALVAVVGVVLIIKGISAR